MLAVVPDDLVVFRPEALALGHLRMVCQHLEVEVAPDQLAQPGRRAAVAFERQPVRDAGHPADRHRAEAQVHAQVARPAHRREVARGVVAFDSVEEILEQRRPALAAGRDLQRCQVGLLEAEVRERRHGGVMAGRRRCQCVGVMPHRIGLQIEVVDLRQPRTLVGREHGVRLAGLGQHLVALEDRLVLGDRHQDADIGQRAEHLRVARDRLGLVVAVGEHGLHVERLRDLGDLVFRTRVSHDQPAAQRAQVGVERDQRFADEFDAAICARQRLEDVRVEHEHADHLAAAAQRLPQRRVVVDAQVASEPHQALGVGLVDGK